MSHYYNMNGCIILSEPPPESFHMKDWESTRLDGKIIVVGEDGSVNHFPDYIERLIESLAQVGVTVESGFGNYHAEDLMSGEWEVVGGEVVLTEYTEIVEELRSALILAKQELEELWDLRGKGYEVAGYHLNGSLEPLDDMMQHCDLDALDAINNVLLVEN